MELPVTADQGNLRKEARDVGTMRPRAAACARDDGSLVVAWTTFDTDEATTQALLDVGCVRVVALDRGSHAQAFATRAGAESPPERRYEVSTLYVVEAPLFAGRAAPIEARSAAPALSSMGDDGPRLRFFDGAACGPKPDVASLRQIAARPRFDGAKYLVGPEPTPPKHRRRPPR